MARKISLLRPYRCAGIGLLSLAAPLSAHADVTVVSQVAVTEVVQPALDQASPLGTPPPPRQESAHSPQTVTTYYKGGNARTEIAGGSVTLYNGADSKIYTLDPAQKTYYAQSVKDTLEPPQPAGENGSGTKTDASIDVKQGTETRRFVGEAAKVYTVSGVVTITPQRRGYGGGGGRGGSGGRGGGGRHHGGSGGGFPGGGGFPLYQNGGYGGGDDSSGGGFPGSRPGGGGRTRSIEVSGEFWLSDAVKLPDDKKASVLPALQVAVFDGSPALKSLSDSLNKRKEIPLDSRLTLTHTVPQTGAQDSVTTTTQVTSISQAPLNDTLFRLPLGYTQVAPPPVDAADSSR